MPDVDEDFSDGDLDALPSSTFFGLEQSAAAEGGNAGLAGDVHGKPAEAPSSDYGLDDDEDVIDLDQQGLLFHSTQSGVPGTPALAEARADPPARHTGLSHGPANEDASARGSPVFSLARRPAHSFSAGPGSRLQDGHATAAMGGVRPRQDGATFTGDARIKELEEELRKTRQAAEQARTEALSKAGENAIVRAKLERSTHDFERRLALLQASHVEEAAKQRTELALSKKDKEKVRTENAFLQHELAQDSERGQATKRPVSGTGSGTARPGANLTPVGTPRKTRSALFADGFDDAEVPFSPTKGRDRSKPYTPKTGSKRKRVVPDASPGQPLHLEANATSAVSSPTSHRNGVENGDGSADSSVLEERYQTLNYILNHRPATGDERTIELLTRHNLPGGEGRLMSSYFMDEVSKLATAEDSAGLSVHVCGIMLDLWQMSLTASKYEPLYLFLGLLEFILSIEVDSIAPRVIDRLLPLAMSTVDLVAISNNQPSSSKKAAEKKDEQYRRKFVDVLSILSLLDLVVASCHLEAERVQFWQKMEYDFVLLLLKPSQPLPQIKMMLCIVRSSTLPHSLGVVTEPSDTARQERKEAGLLDAVSTLLYDRPLVEDGDPTYTTKDVAELRYWAISVFTSFIRNEHGGRAVARHQTALGRIVSFTHDQLNLLYVNPLGPARDSIIKCINLAVRILYHEFTTYSGVIDVRAKLAAVPGAAQKHLVALGRIAFSDGLVIEEGLDKEVIEAANLLLDEFVSPEEGTALLKAFGAHEEDGSNEANQA